VREKELGHDPLDADAGSFLERFEGRKGGVRAALMNQEVLAGIGNTCSEEILLRAQLHLRLHPRASDAHLDAPILGKLHTEARRLLETAIEWEAKPWEAKPHKLPDSVLLSHRREGERCPRGKARSGRSKPQDGPTTTALPTEG
jgi:formamidopyrimidine-DNA glycosylase